MSETETDALIGNHFRYFVQRFRQLIIDKHRADYKVGEFLHRIREETLWDRWPRDDRTRPGFRTWEEFCDKDLGYSTSKANALTLNYRKLNALGLDEQSDTFARCMRLGWSKLNVLLRVVSDESNLIAWLNDIEGRNLSELQLRARIQEARRTQAEANAAASGADPSDGDEDEPLSPENPVGYVPYVVRFDNQQSIDTFTQAVEAIRNRYDTTLGMGAAVTMMAVQYLATVPSQVEGGAAVEVENLIRMVEASYGIRLEVVERAEVAVDPAPPTPRRRRRRRTQPSE